MPALIVERVGPLATLQDRGRRGYARFGVPPSGPLDPEAFERTIAAVGSDVAIELPLTGARFLLDGPVIASIDAAPPARFDSVIEVAPAERAVRYLAVRGGFDVAPIMGSRATLVTAGIGGFEGRALRVGDRLPIGEDFLGNPRVGRGAPAPDDAPIAIEPTFGADPRTLDALFAAELAIDARSDRTGTRLSGGALPKTTGLALSRPVVSGALQLPPDGRPIVLGPDGPTTGGYVVVAVLDAAARARLARRRPGALVHFVRRENG